MIVLINGGSSAGKSSTTRCLKHMLKGSWLTFSIDDFVDAMPVATSDDTDGLTIDDTGQVVVGSEFRRLEEIWYRGLARMSELGADLIVDDVFLDGSHGQELVAGYLNGVEVFWVGLKCDAEIAEHREFARGDRQLGMARRQAESVHEGVNYDFVLDATHKDAWDCARLIAAELLATGTRPQSPVSGI